MSPAPRRSRRFSDDARAAAEHYSAAEGVALALRFIDALEQAVGQIAEYPASGSTRLAELSGLPGLRSVAVPEFPYLIFHVEGGAGIILLRVLHGRRDIPALLQADDLGGEPPTA